MKVVKIPSHVWFGGLLAGLMTYPCHATPQDSSPSMNGSTVSKPLHRKLRHPPKTVARAVRTDGPFVMAHLTGKHPQGGNIDTWVKSLKHDARFYLTRGKKARNATDFDEAARAYLAYARATGHLKAFGRARSLLERADRLMTEPNQRRMPWAEYKMAVHDFAGALEIIEHYVRRTGSSTSVRVYALGLYGDVLFNLGRYGEALDAYRESLTLKKSIAGYARLAHYQRATGDIAGAKASFEKALALPVAHYGPTWAWLLVMRGLLAFDFGDVEGAIPFYEQAVSALPGWYLSTEHLAEAYVEVGRLQDALVLYKNVLKANRDPAFIHALSELYAKLGQTKKSKLWAKRTQNAYAKRLKKYPEMTTGHGLDYYLENGTNEQALILAKAYFKQRPAGDAAVKYAQALLRAGQLEHAQSKLDAVMRTPYSTPDLHGTAFLLYAALGQTKLADEQRQVAIKLCPSAITDLEWLRDKMASAVP